MAANSNRFIRVRLHFDYPPPAVTDCRMCWLLVDLNTCRVVADLESVIRDKFEFSRRSILHLFIEDCYLPHTESVHVVRDNDSVRVKVDSLSVVNVKSISPDTSENCRKRQRPTKEEEPEENGVNTEQKKKKRKKENKESPEREARQHLGGERDKTSRGKCKKKKKKKKKKTQDSGLVAPKPAAPTKTLPVRSDQPVKYNKRPPAVQGKTLNVSSSGSCSSTSEEEEAPNKVAAQKSATSSSTSAASKVLPSTKPTQKKPNPPPSSSSETVSFSNENTSVKTPPKNKTVTSASPKGRKSEKSKPKRAPSALQSTVCAQKQTASGAPPPHDIVTKPCTSNTEEEPELAVQRPLKQRSNGVDCPSSWRRCSRGRNRHEDSGERDTGESTRGITRGRNGSLEFSYNRVTKLSDQKDSVTNEPLIPQKEAGSAPKQDYSSMPLLAAPPPVGQKIAFKLLELTKDYTPEISEYKMGKVVSFDHTTNQIELELLNAPQAPVEPGKFDLIYQNADGSERVEYAVSRGSRVTERWDSLREPRLLI